MPPRLLVSPARALLGVLLLSAAAGCGDESHAPTDVAVDLAGDSATDVDDATFDVEPDIADAAMEDAPDDVQMVDVHADADDTNVDSPDAEPEADASDDAEVDLGPSGPTPDERFGVPPTFENGEQSVMDPFDGIRIVSRTTEVPRPLAYHVLLIDTEAEGLSFRLTPPNGDDPRETTRQTVRAWVTETEAQVGINTHFFAPWPPDDPYADCLGFAASDGDAYSPFSASRPYAIAIGPDNAATFVQRDEADETGFGFVPDVPVDDAFGAGERIITDGTNTATWEELHPRTAAGITAGGDLVFVVVDGRQEGVSEGMTTPEVAELMLEFGVENAINLDGGGSSTLVVSDPAPRVVNVPVGILLPRTERDNGCNLAIFAAPR